MYTEIAQTFFLRVPSACLGSTVKGTTGIQQELSENSLQNLIYNLFCHLVQHFGWMDHRRNITCYTCAASVAVAAGGHFANLRRRATMATWGPQNTSLGPTQTSQLCLHAAEIELEKISMVFVRSRYHGREVPQDKEVRRNDAAAFRFRWATSTVSNASNQSKLRRPRHRTTECLRYRVRPKGPAINYVRAEERVGQ